MELAQGDKYASKEWAKQHTPFPHEEAGMIIELQWKLCTRGIREDDSVGHCRIIYSI